MIHLSDHVTPITPEQAKMLDDVISPFTYLKFRIIGRRGAICAWPCLEPLQFVTRMEPKFVRWLAEGWNEHLKGLLVKAGER